MRNGESGVVGETGEGGERRVKVGRDGKMRGG